MRDIVLETAGYRLTVGEDCIAKSLICKETGCECLAQDEPMALFSATQERPWNNEVKLAYPNKRTTFQGVGLEQDGAKLIVTFEIIPCKAVIEVGEGEGYLTFTLTGFLYDRDRDYPDLCMNLPPVTEVRLCQLSIRERQHFGAWLNVAFDDNVAVNLLAACPEANIDSEKRPHCRVLYAEAVKELQLIGTSAALIVAKPEKLLDVIDRLERDRNMPLGVQSRRSDMINASIFWTEEICPANADAIIAYAKQGGFRLMLLYYRAMFESGSGYGKCGNYDYNERYPNGKADLELVLRKIRAAGILPGLHILQTHIGIESRYVTPVCDARLHHTRRFTLSKALGTEDDTVYVNENPAGSAMFDGCRMLQMGGEVISYEGYTSARPYCFTGCRRGAYNTNIEPHIAGTVGGILDVSEYGATSIYLDQETDLQDEIADKIADAYSAGFRFVYFDGSEGTNAPYGYHVPNAQRRVYEKLVPPPLFTEGAAKAHYSWHHLSGGNAFDVFPADVFKKNIDRFPMEEAGRMRNDFTRVNFGWWAYWMPDSQCDMYEYGTSRAAGWDCPATIIMRQEALDGHPRTEDLLEVMRRWEDVRARKWLTEEQKALLREPEKEYTLIRDESGSYALLPWTQLTAEGNPHVRAFTFQKDGKAVIAFWHPTGEGELTLAIPARGLMLKRDFPEGAIPIAERDGKAVLPLKNKLYVTADTPERAEALVRAFTEAAETL